MSLILDFNRFQEDLTGLPVERLELNGSERNACRILTPNGFNTFEGRRKWILLIFKQKSLEKMSKVCSHCGASAIEVDEEGKLEVCSNCGVVCNEGSFRSNATIQGGERTFISAHDTSSGGGAGDWRLKQQHRNENSNLLNSRKILKDLAQRLRLPKECITQVEEKLKFIFHEQLYKGLPRSRKAFVGSIIYIVCRQNDMVVTLRNVSEAARCDLSILARCVRKLAEKLDINLEAIEPEHMITNVLSQFEIQDTSTKKLVHELFKFCSKTMICSGRVTVLTVMAMVFMVIDSAKKKTISQRKIEEVCRLNTVKPKHVKHVVYRFRTELLKLAKKIPWISPTLTQKQVPKFLKEILEYYKDCEDFHNVDFKLDWQEKKELMAREKMQKIEEAEERIAACQQRCGDLVIEDNISLHKNCKQISISLTKTEVSSLSSSASGLSTATDSAIEDKQTDVDHICCPHCCVHKQDCPVFQRTGSSSFCKLERNDMVIECLLRKGYSKQELAESNPESLLYSKNYYSDSEAEREELDDDDICDDDIHLYIKTEPEMAQAKTLKPMGAHLLETRKIKY